MIATARHRFDSRPLCQHPRTSSSAHIQLNDCNAQSYRHTSLKAEIELQTRLMLSEIQIVNQIMNRRVSTLDASDTVVDALHVMTEKGVGCVIITLDSRPVGILTERDVMKTMMKGKEVLGNKLSEVMSIPLTTVPPNTPVVEALKLMKKMNIRRLPVVSDGELQGIITVHQDLMYWALVAASGSSSSSEYSRGPLSS